MEIDVLFTGAAVRDFDAAQGWYERFFGRTADVAANEQEEMWRLTDRGWLYIVRDADRAGNSIVALPVPDIEEVTSMLDSRGIACGPILREGDAGRKAVVHDPDGNTIAIIEVAGDG
jgi:catechol 2,3-dioxygenase-like lactoylglutathione lyase family enzyme